MTLSQSKRILLSAAVLGFTVCYSGLSGAQSPKIEEGFDYRTLPLAQPVDSKGKVEVIEFFWSVLGSIAEINLPLPAVHLFYLLIHIAFLPLNNHPLCLCIHIDYTSNNDIMSRLAVKRRFNAI